MIAASGILAYISTTEFYHSSFKYLGDLIGYSIITNLVFLKVYQRKAYCNPTKAAVYGLLLMNIISILVKSDILQGRYWYDIAISLVIFLIIVIRLVKRW